MTMPLVRRYVERLRGAPMPDLWDAIAVTGAALAGGGVWGLWGAPWACILWGSLLLGLAGAHAVLLRGED